MDWKNWLKLTPLYDLFGKRSYAQSGEDVVVDAILNRQKNGFYVEVGAYHPKVFSNTYLFYKRGWKGICIEPNPEAKLLFEMARPRDKFVNVGIASSLSDSNQSNFSTRPAFRERRDQNSTASASEILTARDFVGKSAPISATEMSLEYYVFGEGTVNTFSKKQRDENIKAGRKLLETKKIPVRTLKQVLDGSVPKGQKIDLLSVDVEGMDLEVLKSNDWKKYKPKVIIVEDRVVESFLEKEGYEMVGRTGYSMIFQIIR